ncbi:MAG: S9 family peptidase [Pseudomonadota bacterium]
MAFTRLFLLAFLLSSQACLLASDNLTIEQIYSDKALNGNAYKKFSFSPDNRYIGFLKAPLTQANVYDLWIYDNERNQARKLLTASNLAQGEEKLSEAELAAKERMRSFGKGISDFRWAPSGQHLLIPYNGDLFLYQLSENKDTGLIRLTATEQAEITPRFSPDGQHIAFVRGRDLYAYHLATRTEKQLTQSTSPEVAYGVAEFVAQEEMKRYIGFWWSPDSRKIAFTKVNESKVARQNTVVIKNNEISTIERRYPFAGTPNAKVELGVISVTNGKSQWMQLPEYDYYLARVNWFPSSEAVAAQIQTRDQKTLSLVRYDIEKGAGVTLLEEVQKTWTNLHNDLRFLKSKDAFIWSSERSGFRQLYLYKNTGELIRPLSSGKGVVLERLGVDATSAWVYFTANFDNPLETHLYRAALSGDKTQVQKVTQTQGTHKISMSGDGSYFIAQSSSSDVLPRVELKQLDDQSRQPKFVKTITIEENRLDKNHPYFPFSQSHIKPVFGNILADDGQKLYYRLYIPKTQKPRQGYPVVIDSYGGPGVQRVKNEWGSRNHYWHQVLVQAGYMVFTLDNRGMGNRGKRFEDVLYKQLGHYELKDQVAGAQFLQQRPDVDGERIAFFGWSYGGYMALLAMTQASETFALGVSVAPVTDWSLYDTHYTERYIGDPKNDPNAYRVSNITDTQQLKGRLLMIHGMADDNVLFKHSMALFDHLQKNKQSFDMMTYPGAKHSIAEPYNRIHLYNYVNAYFDQYLKRR